MIGVEGAEAHGDYTEHKDHVKRGVRVPVGTPTTLLSGYFRRTTLRVKSPSRVDMRIK